MGPNNQSNMRIINKVNKKIKDLVHHKWFDEVLWVTLIMFVGLGMFSFGVVYQRHAYLERNPLLIEYSDEAIALWETYQNIKTENQEFFGSKNGSIVYPVGCTKGNRIKEENIVFFGSLDDATERGYKKVEGC
jgi:hypothetical protein